MSLELNGVGLSVGQDTHIHPTSLSLVNDRFNVLLGTTLAGKTTLMRLIAGLEKPTAGSVWFNGKDITHLPVQLKGVDKKTMQRTIEGVADLLKLTPMLHRMPSELSGGQQQRTALARALVKSARIVLLDEPLANLDYKLREELREELPRLFRNTGATVVYATTEPSEALLLGGYTAALSEGQVVQFGPTAKVYRKPVNQLSAEVFSDPPVNTTTITKSNGSIGRHGLFSIRIRDEGSTLADGTYTLAIRPHHLTLEPQNDYAVPIKGEVILTEITGSETTLHLLIEGETWISLSRGVHTHSKGEQVTVYLDSRYLMLFDNNDRLVMS